MSLRNRLATLYDLPHFLWGLALYMLNLVDMMATLVFVQGYDAVELNPIVDLMLETNPSMFVFFKAGVVGAFIAFLCNVPLRTETVKKALISLTTLYFLLFLWHLGHHMWFALTGAF